MAEWSGHGAGVGGVTVDVWSIAEQVSCLLLSLSSRCSEREERGYRNKKTSEHRVEVYWANMQAQGHLDEWTCISDNICVTMWIVAFPIIFVSPYG
jgi:hypothetical protein